MFLRQINNVRKVVLYRHTYSCAILITTIMLLQLYTNDSTAIILSFFPEVYKKQFIEHFFLTSDYKSNSKKRITIRLER